MRLLPVLLLASVSLLAAGPSVAGPSAAADTKPPTVPKGLAVAGVTATSVSLSWQASTDLKGGSGVAGYDVFRDGIQIASTVEVRYIDGNVAPATTYRYAVRARDNAGNVSVVSVSVTATTLAGSACSQAPATPTGLGAGTISSTTVALQWTAVPPPTGCVVTYTVLANDLPLTSNLLTASYTATGLQPSTTYAFTVLATDSFGSSSASSPLSVTTTADGGNSPGFPTYLFAPYIDVLLYPTPSLSGIAAQTKSMFFSPGFIVAGSGCQATWGRHYKMSDNFLKDDIAALRGKGGDVIPSFGGAAGTELALACSTVAALQAQYQSVIDTYGLTRIDFDIEGTALSNTAANDRRAQAIHNLQSAATAAGKTLTVHFTLPVMPSGLTQAGLDLLSNAIANKVEIGVVNVMAMDYGRSYTGDMGQYAIDTMDATATQLAALYPSKTSLQLHEMVGVTPMIGLNDVSPEVFTLADSGLLVAAATSRGTRFLSFWSTMRDQPCPSRQVVSATCSGVAQGQWDFTSAFMTFTRF